MFDMFFKLWGWEFPAQHQHPHLIIPTAISASDHFSYNPCNKALLLESPHQTQTLQTTIFVPDPDPSDYNLSTKPFTIQSKHLSLSTSKTSRILQQNDTSPSPWPLIRLVMHLREQPTASTTLQLSKIRTIKRLTQNMSTMSLPGFAPNWNRYSSMRNGPSHLSKEIRIQPRSHTLWYNRQLEARMDELFSCRYICAWSCKKWVVIGWQWH